MTGKRRRLIAKIMSEARECSGFKSDAPVMRRSRCEVKRMTDKELSVLCKAIDQGLIKQMGGFE